MKEQLEQRLQELKAEYTSGQKVLADLEAKQANVRQTLLRIEGAIQILEEELTKNEEELTNNEEELTNNEEKLTKSNGTATEPEKVKI